MKDFKTNNRCKEFNKFAIDFVNNNYSAHILVMFKGESNRTVSVKQVVDELTDRAFMVWEELGKMEFLQDAGSVNKEK